jgi:hypothetical protein
MGRRLISTHSGELLVAGNGCAAAAATVPASPLPHPFPSSNCSRPNQIQRPKSHRTPSLGCFCKEPLSFLFIEPAILGVLPEYAFSFSKRSFFGLNEKYVFRLFTDLPLQ